LIIAAMTLLIFLLTHTFSTNIIAESLKV